MKRLRIGNVLLTEDLSNKVLYFCKEIYNSKLTMEELQIWLIHHEAFIQEEINEVRIASKYLLPEKRYSLVYYDLEPSIHGGYFYSAYPTKICELNYMDGIIGEYVMYERR